MWLPLLLQFNDGDDITLRVLMWLVMLAGGAYAAYQQEHWSWRSDERLSPGMKRRLGIGGPPKNPFWQDSGELLAAELDGTPAQGAAPEALSPAELAELRRNMDAILRAKWDEFCTLLARLPAASGAENWRELLEAPRGLAALHADLETEVGKALRSRTYPPVTLQLSGVLETLRHVLRQVHESLDCPPQHAAALRDAVLGFVRESLPQIRQNVDSTRPAEPAAA